MPIISGLRQSFFIPTPPLTEANLGSLAGKVCIVTGGNSGVGYELCGILYRASATVFLAGRNEKACREAIERIVKKHDQQDKPRATATASPAEGSSPPAAGLPAGSLAGSPIAAGRLEFLHLDLSDLSTIKASAESFLSRADRLDFLCNNAGVMQPPSGSVGVQGHELQNVTNCLGPYLFTDLLTPILRKTAAAERARGNENVVRVAWAGSLAIDTYAPRGGITLVKDEGEDGVGVWVERQKVLDPTGDYGQSKTGNLFLATAWGEEVRGDGIVSTCFNPGNLSTNLTQHLEKAIPAPIIRTMMWFVSYAAIYGAYTELYCGFSPELSTADNGRYIAPWGRKWYVRGDVEAARTGEGCRRWFKYVKREVEMYR